MNSNNNNEDSSYVSYYIEADPPVNYDNETEDEQFTRIRESLHSVNATLRLSAVNELAHFDRNKKIRFNDWIIPKSPKRAINIDWDHADTLPGAIRDPLQTSNSNNTDHSSKVQHHEEHKQKEHAHPKPNLKKQAIMYNVHRLYNNKTSGAQKTKHADDDLQDKGRFICTIL
jgi:hypothetical protein